MVLIHGIGVAQLHPILGLWLHLRVPGALKLALSWNSDYRQDAALGRVSEAKREPDTAWLGRGSCLQGGHGPAEGLTLPQLSSTLAHVLFVALCGAACLLTVTEPCRELLMGMGEFGLAVVEK